MCYGDGLPAQVCQQCVRRVTASYEFKLLCERSDVKLRYVKSSMNVLASQLPEVSLLFELNIITP